MKTESENFPRLDDIIFENRNKEYGAYAIRKNYNDTVLTGWIISLGVVALVFLSSFISMKKDISPPVVPPGCPFPMPPPTILVDQKISPPPSAPKQINKNYPPIATIDEVPDQPAEPIEPTNPGGTEGTGDLGAVDGSAQPGTDVGTVAPPEPPPFILNPEIAPEYEGGYQAMMMFLQQKLHYPSSARRKGEEGTVYVSFVISPAGAVTMVEVIKGISRDCDKEAVRVISMMSKWKPGLQNKMPVAVKLVLPIKFKMDS